MKIQAKMTLTSKQKFTKCTHNYQFLKFYKHFLYNNGCG